MEFDDSATQCSTCGQRRRQPVIRDTFSVSELLTVYGEQEMPVKFVTFKVEETQVIIELQD